MLTAIATRELSSIGDLYRIRQIAKLKSFLCQDSAGVCIDH